MNNMNQMMGNMNMNPMGMNNQLMTNFGMDETAMKLKAIIAPYEQKISEKEKVIKEKDFEILLLKKNSIIIIIINLIRIIKFLL